MSVKRNVSVSVGRVYEPGGVVGGWTGLHWLAVLVHLLDQREQVLPGLARSHGLTTGRSCSLTRTKCRTTAKRSAHSWLERVDTRSVTGCRIDGDQPPATRRSGGAPRPGIEPGARPWSGDARRPVPGRYGRTVAWYTTSAGILRTSQGTAVVARRGVRAPFARYALAFKRTRRRLGVQHPSVR